MVGPVEWWRTREPIPLAALQALGLVCLVVAVWQVRGGWHALGVFGFALLSLTELRRPTGALFGPWRRVTRGD